MRHLNYTHLLYFWTVACEGSIARASEVLSLTPQTISGQIKLLEDTVGEPLFNRVGRGLALTETGYVVKQYGDEIFMLGAELTQRVKSKQALIPTTVNVGVVESLPKLVAQRVLSPAFDLEDPIKVVCREGTLEKLLAEMAIHQLDLVISDRPIPAGTGVKAYNHRLGQSGISFFAHRSIAQEYIGDFPKSLDGAPVLLPVSQHPLRRGLEQWFDFHSVTPLVMAEFEDSALLKAFGEAAIGLFPAPTAIKEEVCRMYQSECIGEVDNLVESYYAISPERKIKHPAVLALSERARETLFG